MSVKPDQLMQSLLNKLYIIVTGGLEGMPVDTDNYVTWVTPGIPFKEDYFNFANLPPSAALPSAPPDLTAANAERAATLWRYAACANEWAMLANFVPSGKPLTMSTNFRQAIYHTSQELLWNVFDNTLRLSQVATTQLTDEEKAKIEKYRNLLSVKKEKEDLITGEKKEVTEDGPVLVAYKQKQQAYLAASNAYKRAEIAFNNAESPEAVNTWRFMENNLRQTVRSAYDDWVTNGYKNEVESMTAYINQVTERDMASMKSNIEDKFHKGLQHGPIGDFYYTSVIPGDFINAAGWVDFDFFESDYSHYASQESSAWSGSAKLGFGLFSAGASASRSTASSYESFDSKNSRIKFKITQVPIARGWFDPGFLIGEGWKWSGDYIGDDLSDGKIPPSGRLVAYPTTALFVQDVLINFDVFHSERSKYESHLKAGGSFGWGPFSIGGQYSKDKANERAKYHFDHEGLHIEGFQLIGFICRFLGKAPDPSSQAHFD